MSTPRFGDNVVVLAETVRVIGKVDGDKIVYRQSWSTRDQGRYVRHEFDAAAGWPGEPFGFDRAPAASDRFELVPHPNGEVFVRLRVLPAAVPEIGVVVGTTWKEEGTVCPGRGDDDAYLIGGRGRIPLLEVALPSTRKARIVLAHVADLRVLALARGAA